MRVEGETLEEVEEETLEGGLQPEAVIIPPNFHDMLPCSFFSFLFRSFYFIFPGYF